MARPAVLSPECGRGSDHRPYGTQFARDQARIGELGDSHGDVESLADDIDETVGKIDLDRNLRMVPGEVGDEGFQMRKTE
jgi:hypothetical protein